MSGDKEGEMGGAVEEEIDAGSEKLSRSGTAAPDREGKKSFALSKCIPSEWHLIAC